MILMDKKEPVSDLVAHNIEREKDVRAATKRLDEYLVQKFDLNKPVASVMNTKAEKKPQNGKPIASKSGDGKQTEKSTDSEVDKKADVKATEK